MHGFEDVTIGWRDEKYTIPANKMLMLIARIEDAVFEATKGDLGGAKQVLPLLLRDGGPPHPILAMMYGAALRYAGAEVSDADVYLSIHEDIANGSKQAVAAKVNMAVLGLLSVISPPVAAALGGRKSTGKKT